MEQLKHECGVALIRLLKPLEYYQKKYGTWRYGINKLYLLMEKQHNRGQEGAGMACVKLNAEAGEEYMFRERAIGTGAIDAIFNSVQASVKDIALELQNDADYAEHYLPYAGELYMGHLRYSTTGKAGISYIHPFLRRNNWRAKNLALCGNFNLTNVDEIFGKITAAGQHPRKYSDTYIVLEQVGHRLDRESERLFGIAKDLGLSGTEITRYIEDHINMANVLRTSSPDWDGGYVMCGITGSGEAFALRDPWGIRTAFWYADDEVVVVASERPVIQTTFNIQAEAIRELEPGEALMIHKSGHFRTEQINRPGQKRACSFERIYFSRGSDVDIYRERKLLGEKLVPAILDEVNHDIDHTVFSFIPNTAEVAYFGMMARLEKYLNTLKAGEIEAMGNNPDKQRLNEILAKNIRCEKVAIKDIKLRTFITESDSRNDLAAHVYDITYGSIEAGKDNLVVIDDSIVRGTTLRQSIIRILDRLDPKKIVIVSSSPQVRYPDYYGIDMSKMSEFIAFKAAMELLLENGLKHVADDAYHKAKEQEASGMTPTANYVKQIYAPFTDREISAKIADMLTPDDVSTKVSIVFQPIEGLHEACPGHRGDWYFSGDYPTPGGIRLVNRAFIDYIEKYNLVSES